MTNPGKDSSGAVCCGQANVTPFADFVKMAEAMRVKGIYCDSAADLPAKMKEFMEYDNSKPVVFHCRVETNEHV